MKIKSVTLVGLMMATIFIAPASRASALVVNGGFETGDLTGWTDTTVPIAAINYDASTCNGDLSCMALMQDNYTRATWNVVTGTPDGSPSGGPELVPVV